MSLFTVLMTVVVQSLPTPKAYAHFLGGKMVTVDDNYQVTFVPYPSTPVPNDNTTRLNFSVLKNNTNINNVYSALVISEKGSGKIVSQYPYRFYEFSDVTIPHVFNKTGDYVVTLQTRVSGDPKYQAEALVASFDISVVDQFQAILLTDKPLQALLIALAIIIVGGSAYVYVWKKI